jgi:hypothetical protein
LRSNRRGAANKALQLTVRLHPFQVVFIPSAWMLIARRI